MLKAIKETIQQDSKTTVTQLVLEECKWKISKNTVETARETLGWAFHGICYCQLIRNASKNKTAQWANENLHNSFDEVVWTDCQLFSAC